MERIVPDEHMEQLVGARRSRELHIAKASSRDQRVYILHPWTCLSDNEDVAGCEFHEMLENGISLDKWQDSLDIPVVIGLDNEAPVLRLKPLFPVHKENLI